MNEIIKKLDNFEMLALKGMGGKGGGAITDGIVVKARDADGYATEVDLYCADNTVQIYQFRSGNENGSQHPSTFYRLTKINIKNAVDKVKAYAFAWLTSLTDLNIDFESLVSIDNNAFIGCFALNLDVSLNKMTTNNFKGTFSSCGITSLSAPLFTSVPNSLCNNCASLKSVHFPRAIHIGKYTAKCFRNCGLLETAEFGSIGNTVKEARPDIFEGCTQSGLTVTVYTNGTYVDTLLANIRNSATNATIIIKASEDTTYNGTSYAASETMLTSTP